MLRLITATSIKFRTNWSTGLQEKLQNYQNQGVKKRFLKFKDLTVGIAIPKDSKENGLWKLL
jgi:hypothetical protein